MFISTSKRVTMASGQANPGYQGNTARYTPSRVQQLHGQVDEVTGVMKDNIQLALDRAGKLDDLQAKTDQLSTHSQQFQVTTKKVKNKYWWKNVKMWILIIVIIAIIITAIVLIAVFTSKKN